MPIVAAPDHVAAAVPDLDVAHARWRDTLGGGDRAGDGPFLGFRNWQYRFRGGAVLELLEGRDRERAAFVARFLERFGPRVHHVTLKVPDLPAALDVIAGDGLEVVDVDLSDERWQEAFVRPSHVGGIIVQVAASTFDDDDWTTMTGFTPTDPAPDGAELVGPLLRHPDLDRAAAVWTTLGGDVAEADGHLDVRWGGAALTVRVEPGATAEPLGLRFRGAPELPAELAYGPAVLPA